jgi:hypothetical protein
LYPRTASAVIGTAGSTIAYGMDSPPASAWSVSPLSAAELAKNPNWRKKVARNKNAAP